MLAESSLPRSKSSTTIGGDGSSEHGPSTGSAEGAHSDNGSESPGGQSKSAGGSHAGSSAVANARGWWGEPQRSGSADSSAEAGGGSADGSRDGSGRAGKGGRPGTVSPSGSFNSALSTSDILHLGDELLDGV